MAIEDSRPNGHHANGGRDHASASSLDMTVLGLNSGTSMVRPSYDICWLSIQLTLLRMVSTVHCVGFNKKRRIRQCVSLY